MSLQNQLDELVASLSQLLFLLWDPVILIPIIVAIIFLIYKSKQYKNGAYYQITKNPYLYVKYDKGKYAEYLTYESLRHFEDSGGKFLFNIYIPKDDNKTTEIDVLLICSKGLFVFECKNYSGWIFGNESQKNWTQTLPKGRGYCHKEYFYNPIKQNASHIKYLKNLVGRNVPMHSIIVFSDRCILKNITIKSNISVINNKDIASTIAQICAKIQTEIYTEAEVSDLYNKLYPYTKFDYEEKIKHVENLRKSQLIGS